jgi:hypothetical protein
VRENCRNYEGIAEFTCKDGSLKLPISAVNDDYCDCSDGKVSSRYFPSSACLNSLLWFEIRGYRELFFTVCFLNASVHDTTHESCK